jgi:hypothetical protein
MELDSACQMLLQLRLGKHLRQHERPLACQACDSRCAALQSPKGQPRQNGTAFAAGWGLGIETPLNLHWVCLRVGGLRVMFTRSLLAGSEMQETFTQNVKDFEKCLLLRLKFCRYFY